MLGLLSRQSHPIQGDGHMAIALNRMALLGRKASQGKGHVVLPSPDSDGSSGAEDPGRPRRTRETATWSQAGRPRSSGSAGRPRQSQGEGPLGPAR
ncbi:unnamed protein product [Boreogadus saida]